MWNARGDGDAHGVERSIGESIGLSGPRSFTFAEGQEADGIASVEADGFASADRDRVPPPYVPSQVYESHPIYDLKTTSITMSEGSQNPRVSDLPTLLLYEQYTPEAVGANCGWWIAQIVVYGPSQLLIWLWAVMCALAMVARTLGVFCARLDAECRRLMNDPVYGRPFGIFVSLLVLGLGITVLVLALLSKAHMSTALAQSITIDPGVNSSTMSYTIVTTASVLPSMGMA
ncbi:hypothetical protein CALCODRAFT_511723 [Calocera cornea HHB12733]|uniref:Transmembrane protein n=1 Tax=Calocera cornea HHB12733 TaxID=1353952 RepID=A0A165CD19_9BASI|nr:hypothetical protein CALCODRAFT_513204 [Calocera cornea HHB12733]KZT53011.1 hypothetical protein CALCODRAFT_511723 [Calocera cornea HHB12733]